MRPRPIVFDRPTLHRLACAACVIAAGGAAQAQSNIKPPQAQAWIDVATLMLGMPAMAERSQRRGAAPEPAAREEKKEEDKKPNPVNILRGILGR